MNKYLNPQKYLIRVSKLFPKLIGLWEKRMINKYGKQPLKHQPVFIIGAPRTGSTILYQVITNSFDVLYIDNLTCNFQNNLFYGFWLSKKLTKHKPHNNFESYHGNTQNYGYRAPSECGGYWYRWLPESHHFIDYDEINVKMIEEIKREITAVTNYFNKPIIFKNLNAGQRLRLLTQCFPNAKYIFIKRLPLFTAQSIYKSRLKLNIPKNQVWGILPKNFKNLEKLDLYQLITGQIYQLEKQILIDHKLVKKGNFLTLNYEELDNLSVLDKIEQFIKANYRQDAIPIDIKNNNKLTLSPEEEITFKQQINKLDWNTYGLK